MDRTAEFLRRKALLADTAATRLHKDFSSFDLAAVHPVHLVAREVEALEAASGKGAKEGDPERGLAEACMAAWRSHEELAPDELGPWLGRACGALRPSSSR